MDEFRNLEEILITARKIGEKLRRDNGNLCSILISGSIKEAEEYE